MTNTGRPPGEAKQTTTVLAFLGVAVVGGSNAVAIRLGNPELEPFWGAALRFLGAAILLLCLVAILRLPLPRRRALTGVVLFGLLNFGLGYAALYWALQETSAGTAQVVLALVPLATFLLAVLQRTEPFRMRGLLGSMIAGAGVVWLFLGSAESPPFVAFLALLGCALCFAQAGIVVKQYPAVHPAVQNALSMAIGAVLLFALSLLTGERRVLPVELSTWISLAHLILLGSIGLFGLVLFVLHRWSASASSYSLLLMPLVTLALGAVVLGEPITGSAITGGLLVVGGVYLGVFARSSPPRGRPEIGRERS